MAEEFKPLLERIRSNASPQNALTVLSDQKQKLSDFTVKVRTNPKGTMLLKHDPEEVVIKLRYTLKFWWPVLPSALAIFTILFSWPLGATIGYINRDPFMGTNNTVSLGFIFFIASTIATIIAYVKTNGWVMVICQKDKIKFGDKTFDRKYFNGMRIGYTVSKDESFDEAMGNDFYDVSMGTAALRLTYGKWGEDLPYMINKYHSAEIVVWMNELFASVGAPEPSANKASEGRREQKF